MARIPLIGGAYSPRSNIAACTRAINLYPEINPQHMAVSPVTHYQRPGLRRVATGTSGQVRAIWNRSDNAGAYVVIKNLVYFLSNTFALTQIGTITTNSGFVSIVDNGVQALLVDGSPYGYLITLIDNSFAQVLDPSGVFQGGNSVDLLDTFTLWGFLSSNFFGSTLAGSMTFDSLYVAAKAAWPDALVRVFVNKRELFLFGSVRSEIWYNAGGALFPFTILPGVYIQHGCVAVGSVASQDLDVFWLTQNQQGQGMVMKQRGYETKRISNHALEYQLRQLYMNGITLADATAFTYQLDGHVFYVLSLPSGNQTWVYDASVADPAQAWHQWCWTDANGTLQRSRVNCGGFLAGAGVFIAGDWANGNVYVLDPNYYFDDATAIGQPITWLRSFPHLEMARPQGSPEWTDPVSSSGRRIRFLSFYADIECGKIPSTLDPVGIPEVALRWSLDRGQTWGNGVLRQMGALGQYQTWPEWRQLGISRDVIFELSYSASGPAALNGGWYDAEVLDS